MLCIVMEFADAGDLSQRIRAREGLFAEEEVLNTFAQCCLALHYVHKRHVLHRDIKSQNIFLTSVGTVKLGDFGIAKVLDHTAAEAITMIGTPIYLAPEVCHSKPYGIKADVWSIGVVLYELLALGPPFTGSNMAALINNIVTGTPRELSEVYSEELRALAFRLLQKLPERRPTVAEILQQGLVRNVAEGLPAWALQPVEVQDLTMPRRPEARRPPVMPESARVEYRQNRVAALATRARVLNRTGRSVSEEPRPKAEREAEHLQALQQAAAQARRDRQLVQQRLQAEKEANAARYKLETLRLERPEAESDHLAQLQEAAAQARRDRRQVQQKIKDLEHAQHAEQELVWNLTEELDVPPREVG